jgi:glycosyltransferase involved in cell wall biosynthesis
VNGVNTPKISFVLPTHNRVAWVGECIQSLLDQTEPDIEIIVINDNSTDGTKEFLDEWATDPRITVIHNSENQGAGRSRNIGMKCAKAPIICVCDDDDFYPEDRAAVTLKWFEENPKSELVNFPYIRVGYFGEHLEEFHGSQFDEKAFKENGTVNYFANPTVAYKTASGLEMGGYPPETKEMTDDIQFVRNWINGGKKIDFDNRAYACLHRVMPNSMMAAQRGWRPQWVTK